MVKQPLDGVARIVDGRAEVTLYLKVDPGGQHDIDRDGSAIQHTEDYASFRWRGQLFAFTATQRIIVKYLHDAYERGTPFVGQASLLEVAGASGQRLRDVFRHSVAWGSLIQNGILHGGAADTFCLVDPAMLEEVK